MKCELCCLLAQLALLKDQRLKSCIYKNILLSDYWDACGWYHLIRLLEHLNPEEAIVEIFKMQEIVNYAFQTLMFMSTICLRIADFIPFHCRSKVVFFVHL